MVDDSKSLNFIPKSSDDEYQTWNNGNNDSSYSMEKSNRSFALNGTNQANMTSGLPTTGDASRLTLHSNTVPILTDSATKEDNTKSTIVTLVAMVALLSIIIVFLVLNNRKRIMREAYSLYKTTMPLDGSQVFNETRITNGQLELGDRLSLANGSSIGIVQLHPIPSNLKINLAGARTSADDSSAQLLLNYSGSYIPVSASKEVLAKQHSQLKLIDPSSKMISSEVYEDISNGYYGGSQQLKLISLGGDKLALVRKDIEIEASKQNEYIYIPSSVKSETYYDEETLNAVGARRSILTSVSDARCSMFDRINEAGEESSKSSTITTTTATTSSTTSSSSDKTPPLSLKQILPNTSTPAVPKSLPPSITESIRIDNCDDVDSSACPLLDKTQESTIKIDDLPRKENASSEEEDQTTNKDQAEKNENDYYQVPLNFEAK